MYYPVCFLEKAVEVFGAEGAPLDWRGAMLAEDLIEDRCYVHRVGVLRYSVYAEYSMVLTDGGRE